MQDFPGNANKNKPTKKAEVKDKVVEKVVSGVVIQKKKTVGLKIKEVFMGGELKSAGSYIAADVLLPALRNLIVEATSKGIERMIYGDSAPNRRPMQQGPRVQYNSPSARYAPQQTAYLPGQSARVAPRRSDIADIIVLQREDADTVVERLGALIDHYDYATVADLYNLVDLPASYTDEAWGWHSLHGVNIRQVREGWHIDLPRIEPI